MDDTSSNERKTAGTEPARETAGEVQATITDGAEAAAEVAEAIGEAERSAEDAHARTPAVGSSFPGEGRDLMSEYTDLVHAHPELIGKGIPEDVYQQMKASERPVLSVYDACMMKKQAEKISQLEAEIAQLRQNAETAVRAPVTGAAGAPAAAEPEDDFLRGFNSYR